MVFINLGVADLERSKVFFEGLGYQINPQFTDDTAACVVVSDTIYVMLLTEDKIAEFTKKTLVNAHQATEVLISLSADAREDVDLIVDKAVSLGGREASLMDSYDYMYGRSFEDLDGHIWEIIWMDPEQLV